MARRNFLVGPVAMVLRGSERVVVMLHVVHLYGTGCRACRDLSFLLPLLAGWMVVLLVRSTSPGRDPNAFVEQEMEVSFSLE